MSYDFYCYRSASGVPDIAEAQAAVDAIHEADEAEESKLTSPQTR